MTKLLYNSYLQVFLSIFNTINLDLYEICSCLNVHIIQCNDFNNSSLWNFVHQNTIKHNSMVIESKELSL